MKEIIFLAEVPKKDYTNGIAESNLRLYKKVRSLFNVYFFKDKPFHNLKNYFIAKIFSVIYFFKNYCLFILFRLKKLFKPADYLYIVISVNSTLGILRNFIQIILIN